MFKTNLKPHLFLLFWVLSQTALAQYTIDGSYFNSSAADTRNINARDNFTRMAPRHLPMIDNVKQSTGMFFANGSTAVPCSCVLVNNVRQEKKAYIITAYECVSVLELNSDEPYEAPFSFYYEMPGNARTDVNIPDRGKSIREFYTTPFRVRVKDERSGIALLELDMDAVNYTPELLKYAYAAGWDISLNHMAQLHHPRHTHDDFVNISHPNGDHKKIFRKSRNGEDPAVRNLFSQEIIPPFLADINNFLIPYKHSGIFYSTNAPFNNREREDAAYNPPFVPPTNNLPYRGSVGSGLFTASNELFHQENNNNLYLGSPSFDYLNSVFVNPYNEIGSFIPGQNKFKFSHLSNTWIKRKTLSNGRKNDLAYYLDPDLTFVHRIPGGFFKDLIETQQPVPTLQLEPTDIWGTLNFNSDYENEPHNVHYLNVHKIFDPYNDNSYFRNTRGFLLADAHISEVTALRFSIYLSPYDDTDLEANQLLYGIELTEDSPFTDPSDDSLGFRGNAWNCQESNSNFPRSCSFCRFCNFFKKPRKSTDIKNNILQYLGTASTKEKKIMQIKEMPAIPIVYILENKGSSSVNVKALAGPNDIPLNAAQLFDHLDSDFFKSNTYAKYSHIDNTFKSSSLSGVEFVDIAKLSVQQERYHKTIQTGLNSGGYLNLVNPKHKIGPIKLSIDDSDLGQKKLRYQVFGVVDDSYRVSHIDFRYSAGVWIDYYNKSTNGGIKPNKPNYNFRQDHNVDHPQEELCLRNNGVITSRNINNDNTFRFINREAILPTYNELGLQHDEKLTTVMRVLIREQVPQVHINPNPNTNDISPQHLYGKIEDYLIELVAPSEEEIAAAARLRGFNAITTSHAEGNDDPCNTCNPPNFPGGGAGVGIQHLAFAGGQGVDDTNQATQLLIWQEEGGQPFSENNLPDDPDNSCDVVKIGSSNIFFDGSMAMSVGDNSGNDIVNQPHSEFTVAFGLVPGSKCKDENNDDNCDTTTNVTIGNDYQIIYEEGNQTDGFSLRYNASEIQFGVNIGSIQHIASSLSPTTRSTALSENTIVSAGEYMFIVLVFDKGEMTLYKNGTPIATNKEFAQKNMTLINAQSDNAAIGAISDGSIWDLNTNTTKNINFTGGLDYFGYATTALLEEEIINLNPFSPSTFENK